MDAEERPSGGAARAGGEGLAYNFQTDQGAAFTTPTRPVEAGAHTTPESGSQQGNPASQSSPGAYAHMPDYDSCRSLITSYFYQVTMGCGTVHCSNPNCFGNPDGPRLDPTSAAIHAVKLAQSTTHYLCAGAAITIPQSIQWVDTPANSDVVPPRADIFTSCSRVRGLRCLLTSRFVVPGLSGRVPIVPSSRLTTTATLVTRENELRFILLPGAAETAAVRALDAVGRPVAGQSHLSSTHEKLKVEPRMFRNHFPGGTVPDKCLNAHHNTCTLPTIRVRSLGSLHYLQVDSRSLPPRVYLQVV